MPYGSRLVVTARTPDAQVTGALHLHDALPQGDVTVSLPGETLAGAGVLEVTVVLEDADVELPLATTPSGDLAVDIVRPTDDGLRLAYAADLRVYERLDALPRIRWASRAEVVPDATDRLAYLSSGQVPDDTVVLSTGQDAGEAVDPGDDASAAISVVEDGGDAMEIHVDAPGRRPRRRRGRPPGRLVRERRRPTRRPGRRRPCRRRGRGAERRPRGAARARPRGRGRGLALGGVAAAGLLVAAGGGLWRTRRRPVGEREAILGDGAGTPARPERG